jgi:hypothetical protein
MRQQFYRFIINGKETYINENTIMSYSKEKFAECFKVSVADTSIVTRGIGMREFLCCREDNPATYNILENSAVAVAENLKK